MKYLRSVSAACLLGLVLAFGWGASAQAESMRSPDPAGGQGDAVMKMVPGEDLQAAAAAHGWVNQSGSVMNFTLAAGGIISGSYINNAPGTGCQGTAYPLTGWVYGNTIAWSVAWTNATASCNSVTAWAGYYDPNTSAILTQWSLAYQTGSGGAIQRGGDVFKYQ
jgi:hypothetical protein